MMQLFIFEVSFNSGMVVNHEGNATKFQEDDFWFKIILVIGHGPTFKKQILNTIPIPA